MSAALVGLPEWPDDSSIAVTPAYDLPCAFPDDSPSDPDSTGVIHHATEAGLVTDRPDLVKRLVEGVSSRAINLTNTINNYWYGRTGRLSTANSAPTTKNGERQTSNPAPSSHPRRDMNVSLVVLSSLVLAPTVWSFSLSSRPLDMRLRVFAALTMIYSLLAVIDLSSPSPSPPPSSEPTVKDEAKGQIADVAEVIPATRVTPVSEPAQIPNPEPAHPPAPSQKDDETVVVAAAEDVPAPEPAPTPASVAPPPAPAPPEKDEARETPVDGALAEGARDADAAPASHETETGLSGVAATNVTAGTETGGMTGDSTAIPSSTTNADADISDDSASTPVAPVTPSKPIGPVGRGYHPAELHPRNASYSSPSFSPSATTLHSNNSSPSSSMKEKGHGYFRKRTTSSYSAASQESGSVHGRKKVGFFDKVRGEAKVIVGRLEHKKEKVEEGKRILHGEDY